MLTYFEIKFLINTLIEINFLSLFTLVAEYYENTIKASNKYCGRTDLEA